MIKAFSFSREGVFYVIIYENIPSFEWLIATLLPSRGRKEEKGYRYALNENFTVSRICFRGGFVRKGQSFGGMGMKLEWRVGRN